MNDAACVRLVMKAESARSWYYPLQKGVRFSGLSGMSVREFLHDALCFDDHYIEESVRTIFLNNSPVDDIDATLLGEGDRMALGSAMPGLVGIVMGRDNPFKSFRDDISADEGEQGSAGNPIEVSVKLFSTLAAESGAAILERGVGIEAAMLADFLADKIDGVVETDCGSSADLMAWLNKAEGCVTLYVTFK